MQFHGVTPNLMYEDAGEALEWLERVLGFEERARYVDRDGVVRQAEVYVGGTEVWLSGHGAGYWEKHERGPDQYLVVWVEDVDAMFRQIEAAGVEAEPPVDQSWGVRNFYVTDPGGYHWGFHRRLESGYQQVQSLEEGGLKEVLKRPAPGEGTTRLAGMNLVARDVEASLLFYRRLGLEIPESAVWRTESGTHHVGAPMPGGLDLDLDSEALAGRYNAGWRPDAARAVLGFSLPSRAAVDERYAELTGSGYNGLQPPYDAFWGARYAIVEDPDGHPVGLMSPLDPERRGAPPSL